MRAIQFPGRIAPVVMSLPRGENVMVADAIARAAPFLKTRGSLAMSSVIDLAQLAMMSMR